ncbi:hypothetical protein LTR07_002536 [Exophiala xenobiotica]|nr:hypothetical protein LTR07_002536 [Exophiala xenobiotica]
MTSPTQLQTIFLIPNLHCPSCASHIEAALSELDPKPSSIQISIVSYTVTVQHHRTLSVATISEALADAGYEIYDIVYDPASGQSGQSDGLERGIEPLPFEQALSRWRSHINEVEATKRRRHLEVCRQCQDLMSEVRSSVDEKVLPVVVDRLSELPEQFDATFLVEGMTCSSCVGAITKALKEKEWVRSAHVSLITHSAEVVFQGDDSESRIKELIAMIEAVGYGASLDQLQSHKENKPATHNAPANPWHAIYTLEGMTCSSCVGNITRAVQALDFVKKVEVSLLSHTASVTFAGKDNVDIIAQAIENAGYGAALESLSSVDPSPEQDSVRTVSIRIAGLYCEQCPKRIQNAIEELDWVTLETAPSSSNPVLTLSYVPDAPRNTIRTVLSALTDVDPSFQASVYHPPTLEERSRKMMAREQRHILYRVILSVTVAIPALIIDLFHRRTIKELRALWRPGSKVPIARRFYRFGSMNMLISFGTSIAYFASIAELIIAATRKADTTKAGAPKSYFDSVVFLTMFLLFGRWIEAYMKAKAGDAVAALSNLKSTEALLVTTDSATGITTMTQTATDLIDAGDIVRIANGSSPPYDGIITEGESQFDESSLTGESMPVKKSIGDVVYSGTINKASPISIRVAGAAGKSMLDSIINVVREGQAKRAPVERIADLVTGYFVPIVVLIVIITWLTWLALGQAGVLPPDYRDTEVGGWPFWSLQFAIAVFVIACPCGLGLAAPTALFVGGGLAAKHGILVKGGGEAFQEASALDCIVFDKTGTLTEGGEPKVTNYETVVSSDGPVNEEETLGLLKRLEEDSTHPLAKAAVRFAVSRLITNCKAEVVEEVAGKGMKGILLVDSQPTRKIHALIGNESLMAENNVTVSVEHQELLDSWKMEGKSVILIAATEMPNGEKLPQTHVLCAIAATADPLRPESFKVVSALRKRGIEVWMLSGDNEKTARAVASKVGIETSNVIAGVLPDQKANKIQYLQKRGTEVTSRGIWGYFREQRTRATVAMVGDGINDSPALTVADVGIAIGSGSEVAISSAGFVLVSSNLSTLLILIDLSRAVFRRIKFNFFWAALYNMIALPVAAGVLYHINSGGSRIRLDPVWAALAMALSSISVVTSSLILRVRAPMIGFRVSKDYD